MTTNYSKNYTKKQINEVLYHRYKGLKHALEPVLRECIICERNRETTMFISSRYICKFCISQKP